MARVAAGMMGCNGKGCTSLLARLVLLRRFVVSCADGPLTTSVLSSPEA